MSLDVYLRMPEAQGEPRERIYIREGGQTKEISRAEWDARNPGQEPITVIDDGEGGEVFSANITHNLNKMADEAGIYRVVWRPDEVGITRAEQLIEPLTQGLAVLEADPPRFQQHNPSNGWGTYEALVEFIQEYLAACKRYPSAEVSAWR